jgi:hypothetical protein
MLRLAFDSEARLARLDFVHQDELSPEDREAAKAEQPGD